MQSEFDKKNCRFILTDPFREIPALLLNFSKVSLKFNSFKIGFIMIHSSIRVDLFNRIHLLILPLILLAHPFTADGNDSPLLAPVKSRILLKPPSYQKKTEKQFETSLETRISVSWKNRQLRDAIRTLSELHEIPIILDRRIPPNQLLDLDVIDTTLIETLEMIAELSEASISILPGVVYIGPSVVAESLRTLIYVNHKELGKDNDQKLVDRKISVSWPDLDQPGKIFESVCKQYQISVINPELIPHDLWMGASLPEIGFNEMASLILAQYDLYYQVENRNEIRLVPFKFPIKVNFRHEVTKKQLEEIIPEIRKDKDFPELEVKNRTVTFSGFLEQEEDFLNRLNGKKEKTRKKANEPVSLDRRRFTLTVKEVSAKQLIELLQKNGIRISYDEEKFQSKNVDLEKQLDIDLQGATIRQFLDTFCKPLGLEYKIDQQTILLEPES